MCSIILCLCCAYVLDKLKVLPLEALCWWSVYSIQRQYKRFLNNCNINADRAEDQEKQAINESAWRGSIHNEINYFETQGIAQALSKKTLGN